MDESSYPDRENRSLAAFPEDDWSLAMIQLETPTVCWWEMSLMVNR
jgi:hypothetical protein